MAKSDLDSLLTEEYRRLLRELDKCSAEIKDCVERLKGIGSRGANSRRMIDHLMHQRRKKERLEEMLEEFRKV